MIPQELLQDLPFFLRAEVEENQVRKDFTQSEKAKAQELMRQYWGRRFKSGRPNSSQKAAESATLQDAGMSQLDDLLGSAFDESRDSVRKRRAVYAAAQEDPERFGGLMDEMDRLDRVDPIYRRLQELGPPPPNRGTSFRRNYRWSAAQDKMVQDAVGICGGDPNDAIPEICRFYTQHNQ